MKFCVEVGPGLDEKTVFFNVRKRYKGGSGPTIFLILQSHYRPQLKTNRHGILHEVRGKNRTRRNILDSDRIIFSG